MNAFLANASFVYSFWLPFSPFYSFVFYARGLSIMKFIHIPAICAELCSDDDIDEISVENCTNNHKIMWLLIWVAVRFGWFKIDDKMKSIHIQAIIQIKCCEFVHRRRTTRKIYGTKISVSCTLFENRKWIAPMWRLYLFNPRRIIINITKWQNKCQHGCSFESLWFVNGAENMLSTHGND